MVDHWFERFADVVSLEMGKAATFSLALITIILWAFYGPYCGYSDTWQLVINTSTTILTFLMVFLLQNTQMRDARRIEKKIDELLIALKQDNRRVVRTILEGVEDIIEDDEEATVECLREP